MNVGNKRGRGLSIIASTATRILESPSDVETLGTLDALVSVDVPSVEELKALSTRPVGHELRIGERFLAHGADSATYVVTVLDPADTLGWTGEPVLLCGDRLLREKAAS